MPRLFSCFFSILTIATIAALVACQSSETKVSGVAASTQTGINTAVSRTENGLGEALMTPLTDLNMRRKPIPELLQTYETAYDPITDPSCTGLGQEIEKLTALLGLDSDASSEEISRSEKAGAAASDMTLGVVSGTSRGLLPFSGLIRTASGASSHERRYQFAFKTGFERRAFLKGVGQRAGCLPPASPQPLETEPGS